MGKKIQVCLVDQDEHAYSSNRIMQSRVKHGPFYCLQSSHAKVREHPVTKLGWVTCEDPTNWNDALSSYALDAMNTMRGMDDNRTCGGRFVSWSRLQARSPP